MNQNAQLPHLAELEAYQHELVSENSYAQLYWIPQHNALACVMLQEYIPFSVFQETFIQAGEIACMRKAQRFIFDKRSLRAFHQPSMEWYFLHWKRQMLCLGLRTHRKILPTGNWFDLAVKTCREELEKCPQAVFLQNLDIQYRQNLTEAIES
jgi:hypothetical protein